MNAYLWLHDDCLPSAILSTAVGELQILTMPTHAVASDQAYRASFAPAVTKDGVQLALTLRF